MKVKRLNEMRERCEADIGKLTVALGFAEPSGLPNETVKITLKPAQAWKIKDLLCGYKELLDAVINSAKVKI